MKNKVQITLPAEWYPQSAVQLTWPHEETDWCSILDEVIPCFVEIAKAVVRHENLIIVCQDVDLVKTQLGDDIDYSRVIFKTMPTNDTWARDHGAITVLENGEPVIYDFTFNGWGMKFAAGLDNQITRNLHAQNTFAPNVAYKNKLSFVLEGGSVESDGKGTLLTTAECLLSVNRNEHMSKEEVEQYLKDTLGFDRILWLNHGYLAGDDTDSHVDTLARLCDEQTIAYVKCDDRDDEHYEALARMEEELESFTTRDGSPYRLIELPMADAVEYDGERIPATYANFLIINNAVLLPFYNSPVKDELARQVLQAAFPDREVIGIDCSALIKQHGSLHCVTMQYPKDVVVK